LHVFQTAPQPVETPQPSKHIFSSGASGAILAHEISASTVYSEKANSASEKVRETRRRRKVNEASEKEGERTSEKVEQPMK